MMLSLHDGGECLEDIKYIEEDQALRKFIGLKSVPSSRPAPGKWLRRNRQAQREGRGGAEGEQPSAFLCARLLSEGNAGH